jgi:hypothetical protein
MAKCLEIQASFSVRQASAWRGSKGTIRMSEISRRQLCPSKSRSSDRDLLTQL